MSLSVLLAQNNDVSILDIDSKKVDKINNNQSTVKDDDIEFFLKSKSLSISATLDPENAYRDSDYIIIAVPTNFNENLNCFETKSIDSVISDILKYNTDALIVIKSTVPIGYTKSLQRKYNNEKIIFSPEFLREGYALKDNLYPSRIIVGSTCNAGKDFANLLEQSSAKKDVKKQLISSNEAEAVKLFANSYLAMRIAFFNELDSFAIHNSLDTKSIIDGVCADERIGNNYNNPSFGYGGYCLPKDTKQLRANYDEVPQSLFDAIISSNDIRKDYISKLVQKLNPKVIGIYRLIMKKNSDNYRDSAVLGILNRLKSSKIEIVIFEPTIKEETFMDSRVINSIDEFKNVSDIILSNRISKELDDVIGKVFSRDVYNNN